MNTVVYKVAHLCMVMAALMKLNMIKFQVVFLEIMMRH